MSSSQFQKSALRDLNGHAPGRARGIITEEESHGRHDSAVITKNRIYNLLSRQSEGPEDVSHCSKDKENKNTENHKNVRNVIDSSSSPSALKTGELVALPQHLIPVHEMVCSFLDEKIDEIEEHYQELSREKTEQLCQDLQQTVSEQECALAQEEAKTSALEKQNQELEEELATALNKLSLVEQERDEVTFRHQQEKETLSQILLDTQEEVRKAMEECIWRTRFESEQRIKDLEEALSEAQSENKALQSILNEDKREPMSEQEPYE